MRVLFEELAAPQRAGGIEAACKGLAENLSALGQEVLRHDGSGELQSGWRPDVVHIHGIWSPALIGRWQQWWSLRVPCAVTVHGMLEPWALAHKKFKKRLAWMVYQRRILQSASLLHGTSERESSSYRKLGLRPAISTIPWGIDLADTENLKAEELKIEERIALFVGRLYPVKGLPLLLDAWARVQPEGWKLRLVGPDEAGHRTELELQVERLGLSGSVAFTGPLSGEALAEEYRQASFFVLPSHTENFGMVIGEALAHGVPVITTQGAPWELLESEGCGWWVPVSVDGIEQALSDATKRSPKELSAMGARGRAVVEERFAWDRIAGEFVDCYRWLLGEGPKPSCVE